MLQQQRAAARAAANRKETVQKLCKRETCRLNVECKIKKEYLMSEAWMTEMVVG